MTRAWTDREGQVHMAVLAYLRLRFPRALIHHSANETGLRGQAVARQIAKQKRMGMAPGFPDLVVLHDGEAMFFEIKAEGGRETDAQKAVREHLTAQGFRAAVVRSVQDVEECLEHWFGGTEDTWQHVGSVAQSLVSRAKTCHENRAGPDALASNPTPNHNADNGGQADGC